MVRIETKRLCLVALTREEVRSQLLQLPPRERAQFSSAWLALLDASSPMDPWVHGFSVRRCPDQIEVGRCGFKGPPGPDATVEIAYTVYPAYQRQGYATEAAEALVRYAFESGCVLVARAHTLPENNASARVLARCGFQRIGEVVDPEDGLVWRWERRKI